MSIIAQAQEVQWQTAIPQWIQMSIAVGIVFVTIVTFGLKLGYEQKISFEKISGKIRLLGHRMRSVEDKLGVPRRVRDEDDDDDPGGPA